MNDFQQRSRLSIPRDNARPRPRPNFSNARPRQEASPRIAEDGHSKRLRGHQKAGDTVRFGLAVGAAIEAQIVGFDKYTVTLRGPYSKLSPYVGVIEGSPEEIEVTVFKSDICFFICVAKGQSVNQPVVDDEEEDDNIGNR